MSYDIERIKILVEEYKLLAGYVDRGFHSIEAQAVQIVLLIAVGIGVYHEKLQLDDTAWLFIAPAIFTMMLRMKAQCAFTYFQSARLTEIEDEINRIIQTNENQRVFYYAHCVAELSPKLGNGWLYPYPIWTVFLDLLGLILIAFSTYSGHQVLSDSPIWGWTAWPFALLFLTAGIWYICASAFILKRFYDTVEGHKDIKCALTSDSQSEN